jgi:hypothetical protein
LDQWEGSVTQRDGVTMSTGGEVTLGRGKVGNNASWANANYTGPKNKKNPHG